MTHDYVDLRHDGMWGRRMTKHDESSVLNSLASAARSVYTAHTSPELLNVFNRRRYRTTCCMVVAFAFTFAFFRSATIIDCLGFANRRSLPDLPALPSRSVFLAGLAGPAFLPLRELPVLCRGSAHGVIRGRPTPFADGSQLRH